MKNNKLVFIFLAIVLGISLVACSSDSAAKDGHITLQYIYYQTQDGYMFFEEESLGIEYFEINGNRFRSTPYTIYNLPGNKEYHYEINAYNAEGTLMASGTGSWMVVEGITNPQTATLTVRHQHSFSDWIVTKEATQSQTGIKTRSCSVCGYEESEEIPAIQIAEFIVGDIGPAGGYIFYDCDADNNTGNADGLISTEVGWRYLEAAPADLKVVDGVPTVDKTVNGYSDASDYYSFGYYRKSDSGSDLFVNGTTTYKAADCTGTGIGTGKTNTRLLVDAMGNEAYRYSYTSSDNSLKTADYAARLCDILTYTANGVSYDDWFLPSRDELNLMYENLEREGLGGFANNYYWSSSEYYSDTNDAWRQGSGNGYQYYDYRNDGNGVRPVRAF